MELLQSKSRENRRNGWRIRVRVRWWMRKVQHTRLRWKREKRKKQYNW